MSASAPKASRSVTSITCEKWAHRGRPYAFTNLPSPWTRRCNSSGKSDSTLDGSPWVDTKRREKACSQQRGWPTSCFDRCPNSGGRKPPLVCVSGSPSAKRQHKPFDLPLNGDVGIFPPFGEQEVPQDLE